MDDLGFDIGGLLSQEEAEKLFDEQAEEHEKQQPADVEQEKNNTADADEEDSSTQGQEKVGVEEKENENESGNSATVQEGDGSSPDIYSSIARALKNDGIFPDFEDTDIDSVKTPEDFAEMFEKAITSKLDERQKRIDAALNNGVAPDTVKAYEQTIQYLNSIEPEAISAEGQEGEDLRKQLIYNDLINRGFSHEKAQKEVEKSFKAGSDIDDAKDALESLTAFYNEGYKNVQDDARKKADERRVSQKKQADSFRKLVLDDDVKLGETKLDKRTCQKVYDAVSKPVYKDPDTGQLMTAVQKFQKEQPLEFLKQLGMWYVLTDGGKNIDGLTKGQVNAEKTKAIRELGRKINTSSLNRDGSLQLASGSGSDGVDPLLSDGWKVGW